jgi:hypothetical protein
MPHRLLDTNLHSLPSGRHSHHAQASRPWFEKCLSFKDDSTTASTAYITVIKEFASQLRNVMPMSIVNVYALVTH